MHARITLNFAALGFQPLPLMELDADITSEEVWVAGSHQGNVDGLGTQSRRFYQHVLQNIVANYHG